MAVDETLLESAARENRLTLRSYQWSEPTLSLGYFQRYEDRQRHRASLAAVCVRRSTGGGAILHDRELTYSIAVPQSHALGRNAQQLYDALHQSLIDCLRKFGVADLCLAAETSGSESFLCFQRRAIGDVLLGSHKVAGSAQRRRHSAVLQHGSILLSASQMAPELPGINDLTNATLTADELAARWKLPFELEPGEFMPNECLRAAELAETRFDDRQWTLRR
jgi:lipoate-protein ligase A